MTDEDRIAALVTALKPFARLATLARYAGMEPAEPMKRALPRKWPAVAALYEAQRLVEVELGKGWQDRDAAAAEGRG